MCYLDCSSKIQKEAEELIEENKVNSQFIEINILKSIKLSQNWYKNKKLLKTIYRWAPYLKKIYMTGGEPVLIKENWDLIDYLKEKGYAKNIELEININCTLVPDKLLDTSNHFKNLILLLSVDGYKEVNEYIRYPSKWKVIENNVIKILKMKNEKMRIAIFPTLQIYNILYITKLFKWADKLNQMQDFYIHPDHWVRSQKLDIQILPTNVRQVCLNKILCYEKERKILDEKKYSSMPINRSLFYHGLNSVKTVLKSPPPSDFKHHLTDFRKYTEMLDKKRGQSFKKTFPKLYELLEQDGSWKQHT